MIKIYAYKQGSKSAKALAQGLGVKRLRHVGCRWRPQLGDKLINWGSSEIPQQLMECRVLNRPPRVGVCTNKALFFQEMDAKDVRLVPWTQDADVAGEWLAEGCTVVARQKLQGHSGEGIVVIEPGEELVRAPLYTQYKKKKSEWRVHIANEEVIFVQQKVRKQEVPDDKVNWKVRNHGNGFVYAHKEVQPPVDVLYQATRALEHSGLDFGAVDVIWNEHEGQAYVLEINCAPGLEGTTLEKYVESFR